MLGRTHVALHLRAKGWDHIQNHSEAATATLRQAMVDSIRQSREVVVDSSNLSAAERAEWIRGARQIADVSPSASAIDPNHLQYREKWLSPESTANLAEDQAREQIHNAMKILDPSFDIPDISEGIDTLTHIRSQVDMDQANSGPPQIAPLPGQAGGMPQYTGTTTGALGVNQPSHPQMLPSPGTSHTGGLAAPLHTQQPPQPQPQPQQQPQPQAQQMWAQPQGIPGLTMQPQQPQMQSNQPPKDLGAPQQAYQPPAMSQFTPGLQQPVQQQPYGVQGQYGQQPRPNGFSNQQAPSGAGARPGQQAQLAPPGLGGQSQPQHIGLSPGMGSAQPQQPLIMAVQPQFSGAWQPQGPPVHIARMADPYHTQQPQQQQHYMPQNTGPGNMGMHASNPNKRRMESSPDDAIKRSRVEPQQAVEPVKYDTSDTRPILLFELSGVLCNSTKDRVASLTKAHLPRPGIAHLVRLMPHFRLGVYTTSTSKTVTTALSVLASAIRGELASMPDNWRYLLDSMPPATIKPEGEGGSEEAQPQKLVSVPPEHAALPRTGLSQSDIQAALRWQLIFEESLVLTREHCEINMSSITGRESTCKVPNKAFPDAQQKVLLIDEPSSTAPAENLITVRKWNGSNRSDSQIKVLVDRLLEKALGGGAEGGTVAPTADLRGMVGEISRACAIAKDGPKPTFKEVADSQEGYYEQYPIKSGVEVCSFYVKCGYCKFSDTCVKTHPIEYRVKLNKAGFPMRPGKPNCIEYMRDGFCQQIKACMYNHPNLRVLTPEEAALEPPTEPNGEAAGIRNKVHNIGKPPDGTQQFQVVEEDWTAALPQAPGKPVCEEFVKEGGCAQGSSCEKHHPLDADVLVPNNYGLPMRNNQPVCDFFVRTGTCRFGVRCHKHHPHLLPGPVSFGPATAISVPGQGGSDFGGPRRQTDTRGGPLIPRRTDGAKFSVSADETATYPTFPRNAGSEACPHFMRTGHCKFGMRCTFDHPAEGLVLRNKDNLPMRPGQEVCKFYLLNGECGYGPACMKHHPNLDRLDGGIVEGGGPAMMGAPFMGGMKPNMGPPMFMPAHPGFAAAMQVPAGVVPWVQGPVSMGGSFGRGPGF